MIEKYEKLLAPARNSLVSHPLMSKLFTMDNLTLEKFLMYSAAVGYSITKPVEEWLFNASNRCRELGYNELSIALFNHSRAEAGHDKMRYRDLIKMCDRIYLKYGIWYDFEKLINGPTGQGSILYSDLHNNIAKSDKPFLQLAIQYEIERLPVLYGQMMMDRYSAQLGKDILDAMEFMREHVVLDVGHTAFNKSHISKFLKLYPEYLDDFVSTGIEALESYKQTTIDIYEMATNG